MLSSNKATNASALIIPHVLESCLYQVNSESDESISKLIHQTHDPERKNAEVLALVAHTVPESQHDLLNLTVRDPIWQSNSSVLRISVRWTFS